MLLRHCFRQLFGRLILKLPASKACIVLFDNSLDRLDDSLIVLSDSLAYLEATHHLEHLETLTVLALKNAFFFVHNGLLLLIFFLFS